MDETRTLYLVDGTAQLFRAFFAIRGLSNDRGLPTGAVFGFTAMLRKLIQDERPDHLAVAWDLAGPTFRHERFADYKANRPDTPEDLNVQFPYAKRVCEVFGIPALELEGYEADDLIATFVRLARERGYRVVVVSADKDLLQLVGEGVESLNPGKDLRLDASGVASHFGVPPERVIDVLGLMGDAVDNIPGVPGVGEKTSKAMVATYGPMDAILERAARFVAAWEARDAVLEAFAAVEGESIVTDGAVRRATEAVERFAAAMHELVAVERDDGARERFEQAVATVEAIDRAGWSGEIGSPPAGIKRSLRAPKKMLKDLDKGAARKVWTAVHDHRDQARMSRELATVDRDVPVEFDEDALAVGRPDREAAAALFRELGFRRLTEEFEGAPAAAPESATSDAAAAAGTGEAPAIDYETVLDRDALARVAQACRQAGRFAVDTETDGVDPMRARLVGISLSARPGRAAYVPVGHRYLGVPDQLPLEVVRDALGPLLRDPAVAKVGQNLKYDLHVLRRHGMPVDGWAMDTMVAAFVLDSSRGTYNMDALAAEYLDHRTVSYAEVAGSGRSQRTLDHVEVERVSFYAAEDADVTLRLADTFAARLEAEGLAEVYRDIDHPILPILAEMEAYGIAVDRDKLARMSSRMHVEIEALRREILDLAGDEFNVDSPKQLREVLFDRLGLRPRRKTAKGKVFSTDAQTLEELVDDHPIAARILEYRERTKLKGTYVDALPQMVHPDTGRIHTSFHPTGAATGRLSSSDPNLQNIPARTEAGLAIREAFVAEDGWAFLAADYSQVELRVLAHLCGDPALIEAFRAGEDIHRVTAARVAGVEPDRVTPEMRRAAKAVNFGILYGMSESRLAREQGMDRDAARAFIESYFERFASVRAYIDGVRERVRHDGAVRTMFGRVRRFPQLLGKLGRAQQEQALRAAVNTTIQGTAADLMKRAMVAVRDALRETNGRARMLLQVHDELLLEVPADEVADLVAPVRRAMETVHPLEVPLVVDVKVGPDWRAVT